MVSTRSKGKAATESAETGEKRSGPTKASGSSKKAKVEKDGKLDVGADGIVGLKEEEEERKDKEQSTEGSNSQKDAKEDQGEGQAEGSEKPKQPESGAEVEVEGGETHKPGDGPLVRAHSYQRVLGAGAKA